MSMRILSLAILIAAVLAEEEEKATPMAMAIAATLIGAVSFVLAMLYLTNHKDPDMRRYTYDIINETVSIFSAVLVFQSFNDTLETTVLEGKSATLCVVAHFLHMFLWYGVMHLSLAYISGAIGEPPKSLEEVELNMKSVAIVLGHLTGFASINAWGSLQHLEYFSTPLMSFAVLPISILGQFVIQRCTDAMRRYVSLSDDGEWDDFEKFWDEEIEECENDIMALSLSFSFIQAARFVITSNLPNLEGAVHWQELQEQRMAGQQFWLYAVGLCCAGVMLALFWLEKTIVHFLTNVIERIREAFTEKKAAEESEEEEEEVFQRALETAVLTMSMCFAWCMFFSTRIWLTVWPQLADPMLSAVVLTMVITFVSLVSIRLLDLLADAKWTDKKADRAVKQLIKAIALGVGFAWEQCFDEAVASITSGLPYKHTAKVLLGILSVAFLAPAWRLYLLPMTIRDGWKFGFVVQDHMDMGRKFVEVVDHLDSAKSWKARLGTVKTGSGDLAHVSKAIKSLMEIQQNNSSKARSSFFSHLSDAGAVVAEGERQPVEVPYVALPEGENMEKLQEQLEIVRNIRAELSVDGSPALFRREQVESGKAPEPGQRSLTPPSTPPATPPLTPRQQPLPKAPRPRPGRSQLSDDLSKLEELSSMLLESGLFDNELRC